MPRAWRTCGFWRAADSPAKLRLMAVASGGPSFGSGEAAVLVRSPLLVQSSWPRFAAPGDKFLVPLAVFNNTPIARRSRASRLHVADGPLAIRRSQTMHRCRPIQICGQRPGDRVRRSDRDQRLAASAMSRSSRRNGRRIVRGGRRNSGAAGKPGDSTRRLCRRHAGKAAEISCPAACSREPSDSS